VVYGFRCAVDENRAPLGYYAASSGNTSQMFRDSVSVPPSDVKKSKKKTTSWPLNMGPIRCPETSVEHYHSSQKSAYAVTFCSEIHTKHTNALCGQNAEFLNVKPGGT
jgi:hypothetical protein